MACTATCGSSAQAWTQRSPSDCAGSEVVGREVRQPAQRGGLPRGEPEPVLAAPRGTASARSRRSGSDPTAAARSPRRCRPAVRRTGPRSAPYSPAPCALGHPGGGGGPVLQQRDQLVAVVGGDVEGGEVQPVLGRGGDAGLVLAVEGVRPVDRRAPVGRTSARWHPTPGGRPTPIPATRPRRRRAAAAGRRRGRALAVGRGLRTWVLVGRRRRSLSLAQATAAVSLDRGSDSAFTASDSCLTSAW